MFITKQRNGLISPMSTLEKNLNISEQEKQEYLKVAKLFTETSITLLCKNVT